MSNSTQRDTYDLSNPIVYGSAILFVLAIIWFIVLSFTQKRTQKALKCCGGRPGIVYPINLLNPRHRFVYVLACAALSSQWFELIVKSGGFSDVNRWVSNIVQIGYIILLITFVIIITYPILACVECPIPIIGYILGAVYTTTYLGLIINVIVSTMQGYNGVILPSDYRVVLYSRIVISFLPQVICLFGVLTWYVYKFIKEIVRLCKAGNEWSTALLKEPESQVNINYVKRLLTEKNPSFFQKHINTRIKLPLPIMIVFVVAAIIVFQLVMFVVFEFPYIFKQIGNFLKEIIDANSGLKDYEYIANLPRFFDSLTAITIISPILAAIILTGHFCHFLYTIRVLIKEFRNGKMRQTYPERFEISWPTFTLASSLRYAGYQVAAIITGWIVYTVLLFVILLVFMLLIFFPSFFGYYAYQFTIIILWTVILTVSQMAICKFIFVANEYTSMKTLVINNRRVFNFFSYAMLLYNIATGLMTAIMRIALSFISMVLLLPRMDKIVFLRGFERFDNGFGMFNSYMTVNNSLHNPIVHVFLSCVQSSLKDRGRGHQRYEGSLKYFAEEGMTHQVRSVKARNRWFVAYTLIKNPRLKKMVVVIPSKRVETSLPLDSDDVAVGYSTNYTHYAN